MIVKQGLPNSDDGQEEAAQIQHGKDKGHKKQQQRENKQEETHKLGLCQTQWRVALAQKGQRDLARSQKKEFSFSLS